MRLAAGAAVVLLVVLIAHWTAFDAGALTFDDAEYLTGNPLVKSPSAASAWRFLSEVLEPSTVHGYYQPLTMISLMFDYALGGRPDYLLPFHRTSLLLHMANTLLVMWLLYRLFGDALAAGVVGLLFGVHPLTVETIVWVGERKTVLAAFLALLSVAAYLRFVRTRSGWAYAASVGAFALALLSKPTVTPLPVCLLLMDLWPLERFKAHPPQAGLRPAACGLRRVIPEKLPFFVVAAVSAWITVVSQGRTAVVVMPSKTISRILYIICHDVVFYLWKMVLPIRLSPHYPFPDPLDLSSIAVAAGVVGTVVLIGVLAVSWRWTRALVVGWACFLVAVFPTLGVIGFTNVIASDKYVYWPSFGLLMILAWGIGRLRARDWGRAGRRVTMGIVGGAVVAALALSVGTRLYLREWSNTERLHLHMLRLAPNAAAPLDYLGFEYLSQGRAKEAVPLLAAAVKAAPGYEGASLHLGEALQATGDLPGAAAQYRRALALEPRYFEAYNNLGNVLWALKDVAGARAAYEQAIAFAPGPRDARHGLAADAHYNLANVLRELNEPAKAEAHYRQAIAIRPGLAAAHKNLGVLLWETGQPIKAAAEYEEALRCQPQYWDLAIILAGLYMSSNDPALHRPARAVQLAEQAVAATREMGQVVPQLQALVCLAKAYAQVNRAEQAAAAARAAMDLARATGNAQLMQYVQTNLAGGRPAAESRPAS